MESGVGDDDLPRTPGVVEGPFRRPSDRRSALDRAHRGDIEGALGKVAAHETGPRGTRWRGLGRLLAIMGPGVIVMVGDNEAGSLSVYGQAGQNYGTSLIWLLLPLAGVLFVNQEMVARLGAVTGAGHARLIYERFGRRWGAFSLIDLIALCLLTIVTEFIGVDLAAGYLGLSRYVAVPLAAAVVLAATATGSFRRWERVMYTLVAFNMLVIPLAAFSTPHPVELARGFIPGLSGGLNAGSVLFVIALVGATVTPWQLFFHQSNVVDKRITGRWFAYERVDTLLGTLLFALGAIAVVATCAFAFGGTSLHGRFRDAGAVAVGLQSRLGHPAGILFALVLLNGSILGALVVTLGAAYAVGDVWGVKHSLHRRWRDAPRFYGVAALLIVLATGVVLTPNAPLGIVTTAVQALAGILLPSALVFLMVLCNDREVLGPWVNPPWLNAITSASIGVLLVLSAVLTFTIALPGVGITPVALGLFLALVVVFAALAASGTWRSERRGASRAPDEPRADWTMPPLESLAPPVRTRARVAGLVALRCYMTVAVCLLILTTTRSIIAS